MSLKCNIIQWNSYYYTQFELLPIWAKYKHNCMKDQHILILFKISFSKF